LEKRVTGHLPLKGTSYSFVFYSVCFLAPIGEQPPPDTPAAVLFTTGHSNGAKPTMD
jgi:hypothetical protein